MYISMIKLAVLMFFALWGAENFLERLLEIIILALEKSEKKKGGDNNE